MQIVLYYDPDSARRNRVLSALSSEFDVQCFASMAELKSEAGKGKHALALDGSPRPSSRRNRDTIQRIHTSDGSVAWVSMKCVRLCDESDVTAVPQHEMPILPVGDDPAEFLKRLRECIRLYGQYSLGLDVCLGTSDRIKETLRDLRMFACAEEPLLISGETGTGKELAAHLTHRLSDRSSGPYITFNCANLNAETADSILFGSVRGGFTDATDREGLFAQAEGGTLFLDEIGSLPPAIQPKLLRSIEGGGFRRVGGSYTEYASPRIVTASCEDLHARAKAGTFRPDLLYRLCYLELWIPPLRERASDIVPLAQHFCFRKSYGLCELSAETLAMLAAHEWPGNIRELKATVEKAVIRVRRGPIGPEAIRFAGEHVGGGCLCRSTEPPLSGIAG